MAVRVLHVLPLSILFAILAAGTAPSSLAQEGPVLGQDTSFSIQGGVLWPDEFGDLPPPGPPPPGFPGRGVVRSFRDGEPGAFFGIRVAFPVARAFALEGGWDFALMRTFNVEELNDGSLDEPYGEMDHKTHVYALGLRYAPFPEARVRPHATTSVGGISLLTDGEEDGSATDLAMTLGVGLTVPLHRRYGLRLDFRDVVQFCEERELRPVDRFNPCAEDGPRHHLALVGGVEVAF